VGQYDTKLINSLKSYPTTASGSTNIFIHVLHPCKNVELDKTELIAGVPLFPEHRKITRYVGGNSLKMNA
jgi:hypothetical protein